MIDAACFGKGSEGKYSGGSIGSSRADAAGADSHCDFGGSLEERECVAERCRRVSDGRTMAICEGMEEFSIMTRARVSCRLLVCLVVEWPLGLFAFVFLS